MMWMRPIFRGRLTFVLGVTGLLATVGGANLAVFALVNALWLRPVPVKDADSVVIVHFSQRTLTDPLLSTFADVAGQGNGLQNPEPVFRFMAQARPAEVMAVTSSYFRLFGLDIRGRHFDKDDDRDGAEPVAIISDRLWSDLFGRRADVIGTVVPGEPVSLRVIGVAPPGFEGAQRGERTDVWVPPAAFLRLLPVQPDNPLLFTVWARLRPGETIAATETRLRGKLAMTPQGLLPVSDVYGTPRTRTTLLRDEGATRVVAGVALLVLLGGFAALASLMLVHFERRRLEFGIRAAVGASPGRLIRSVVAQLAIVGVAGTLGALVVADLALRSIGALHLPLPAGVDLTRLDLSFDWRVVAAGLALTTLTLTLAAVLPFSRLMQRRLVPDLFGGPAATASAASHRLRQALLSALTCATVVVLVSATLLVRSVHHAYVTSPGFDVERLLFASVPVAPRRVSVSPELQEQRVRLVREALSAVQGVEGVAVAAPPIDESRAGRSSRPFTTSHGVRMLNLGMMLATPDVLGVLGVPIVVGRDLSPSDIDVQPTPVVMTESVALALWPDESPLGQTTGDGYYVVVGVARDFVSGSLADPMDGVMIVPRNAKTAPRYILRTTRTDAALVEDVRRTLSEVLLDTPAATVLTGREVLERDLGPQRLGAWFFSAFGLVALGVGVGSVFGMVAYLAESRRREFGVRLALGATPRDVVWHGMSAALLPVLLGLAVGLAIAAGVSRVFDSQLVGVTRLDAVTYAAVAIVLLSAAALAALTGAWRLRKVDPVQALRTY